MKHPSAILLMGPSASGKTQLALFLHQHLPVDIVSVDAAQVYRGMDIGTAKPTREEQARAPHRLIDIRDPSETYSAAEFCVDALREMEEITRRGRIPLLVGGTMFYFRALEGGLSPLPSADVEVRARLSEEAGRLGWPALHERLRTIDPEAAMRINPNDAQRVQRALEVIEISGKSLTSFSRNQPPVSPPYNFINVALIPEDRAWLHQRVDRRFREMLELGLLDEVSQLHRRGDLSPALPSVRTVGYRQVWDYLTGQITYNQMTDGAIAATRQLVKRQLTWLRRYRENIRVFNSMEAIEESCLKYLHQCVAERV